MRRRSLRAFVVVSLLLGASVAFAFSTGPPASRTGAPAVASRPSESACNLCHNSFSLNDPAGQLRILDLPDTFQTGQSYPLRLQVTHQWPTPGEFPRRWGFQIQAVSSTTGDAIGTWAPLHANQPDSFRVIKAASVSVFKNRVYMEHTCDPFRDVDQMCGSIREGNEGPIIEWNLVWTAPPSDSGNVYFFAASNSADGTFDQFNDFIFTTGDTMLLGPSGGVGVPGEDIKLTYALVPPFPNPMKVCTNIDFTIPVAGDVDLAIFDAQGRRVRQLMKGFRSAGTHGSTWDGRDPNGSFVRNGVYFLRLRAPGRDQPLVQKVTMAR